MQLDRNQLKAVTYNLNNLLVIAGPGSGKTAVLTQRIHYLITDLHICSRNILVLTFTKAASEEMKRRYLSMAETDFTDVTFGTFHSVFLRILKEHCVADRMQIIGEQGALSILKLVLQADSDHDSFSHDYADKILNDISRIKNGLRPLSSDSIALCGKYRKLCKEKFLFDYDDILLQFYQLLVDDPAVLEICRKRFQVILIDEFQDINRIQFEILKLLCFKDNCFFAVGDDDQSIYGFRGSDPEYMRLYTKIFPRCGKIFLTRNYRCTGSVVKASSSLINHNKFRIRKHLKSDRRYGLLPDIRGFTNLSQEADYICRKISAYDLAAAETGISGLKYAVLARTNRALELIRSFIPAGFSDKIDFRTFHSSKGLEYDAVFVTQANESVTPGKRYDNTELEEERRAFYVAITRCRTYLHIFYTKNQYNDPESRFISEMSVFFKGGSKWMK